ncbi:pyruvate carboxylase [Herbaspirillum sp. GCM10030257]|uniref:pyruvate carboxylase n=1 Tax=Herbaspirillum sp. GCM10030257 TaxID=3273393 RepID=UPI003619A21F
MKKIKKILVANRGEIAIRIMRAAAELHIKTVAIYSHEDRFSLHRFKADESYQVGEGKRPLEAYLDIADVLRIAKQTGADAIHPGYGFLSENPDFAQACADADIIFIGPKPDVMRTLGNKIAARRLAISASVPVMPASDALPQDDEKVKRIALEIGYPLMLKASWGGGGRGMRIIERESDLLGNLGVARREALSAFGNDEMYFEKLVRRARHVEVQILGDTHGTLVHLFERDCSLQRRNQKVVEQAPAPYLNEQQRQELCSAALRIGRAAGYSHAGTVEFLMDADTDAIYFIEVNPRIQVEHTVTEQVTGIDIVKAQIRISEGARLGEEASFVPHQDEIRLNGFALQCRVTTEDPANGFMPDYGRLTAFRSADGFGIRLDGGTAYADAVVTPYYDSLLVKVTAWGKSRDEAIARMTRALREFRIRGVASNLQFLENVISTSSFKSGTCTTRFIDTTPGLTQIAPRRDRATKLLKFVGDVHINGNSEMKGRSRPPLPISKPVKPTIALDRDIKPGSRDLLRALGPEAFSEWIQTHPHTLLTDTTMRDAHQSLFATRMRTYDMEEIAAHYARLVPELFSIECWGGATFDVAMRFLKEDPWERLARLRAAIPNILFQMLLRGSNAVGYTNYADNVVRFFVEQSAKAGIDLFRVFDSLNAVDNMRVAIDAVRESGALCEGAICYTADIFNSKRSKYNLQYYVSLAKQLERAGVHLLAIKDMAGVCRPEAARQLVKALKEEVGLPIHFHTHDTSGISAASALAAVEAGADIIDGALDSMSGLTSQPSLGAMAAALESTPRRSMVDNDALRGLSSYWEGVRRYYSPFESDIRAGTSDVYRHEMPGGQYTNLREQARAMGLEQRWSEIAQAYADVNQLFGDIVKVTPTSKVVGDMAIFMVAGGITAQDVLNPEKDIAFPESVVSLFKGELGFPPDGFPVELQKKVLKGDKPLVARPGSLLPSVDFDLERRELEVRLHRSVSDRELASYLMYPKIFLDYAGHRAQYGDVSVLPTDVFFYGLEGNEEIQVSIEPGKKLILKMHGHTAATDEAGVEKFFFELNGQPRLVRVPLALAGAAKASRTKAEASNPCHVAAPMPGAVVSVSVSEGLRVKKGQPLLSIEAMKMESLVSAERDGVIRRVHVKRGDTVTAKDLLLELE